ncbi:MAG: very short patch repair endonuclease [Gemmatimonadaceae bacterium]
MSSDLTLHWDKSRSAPDVTRNTFWSGSREFWSGRLAGKPHPGEHTPFFFIRMGRSQQIGRRVPRFSNFSSSSPHASRAKQGNRSSNTKPERILRTALRSRGLRAKSASSGFLGRPDFAFPEDRIVVFLDGDFWHGRHWKARRERLLNGSNADYWIPKIESNIKRDRRINRLLRAAGWKVIRVWETDLLRRPSKAVDRIERLLRHRACSKSIA